MKKMIASLLSVSFLLGATSCANGNNGGSGTVDNETYGLTLVTEYKGETVDILCEDLRAYLNEEDADAQRQFLVDKEGKNYDMQTMYFEWESENGGDFYISFADNAEFNDALVFETMNTGIGLGFFVPGTTYYWRVENVMTGSTSKVDSFTVLDSPVRVIGVGRLSGGSYNGGAYNVRDIGGWTTESGKTVKYGMLYRGSRINDTGNYCSLTADGLEIFEKVLKIQTEIDLRTAYADDSKQTENCLNSELGYLKAPFTGYTYIFPEFSKTEPIARKYDARTKDSLKSIFETLSDEKNYPIYFHCNSGADRTGTLAFLINGLLGVSYEDLTRDFEITSFSKYGKRWRGSRENFQDGVMEDDANNYVAWGELYEYMMKYYGTGKTLSQAIENYLVTCCELEQETLDKVKNLLLVSA